MNYVGRLSFFLRQTYKITHTLKKYFQYLSCTDCGAENNSNTKKNIKGKKYKTSIQLTSQKTRYFSLKKGNLVGKNP